MKSPKKAKKVKKLLRKLFRAKNNIVNLRKWQRSSFKLTFALNLLFKFDVGKFKEKNITIASRSPMKVYTHNKSYSNLKYHIIVMPPILD